MASALVRTSSSERASLTTALAATAGVDLGLDDPYLAAEILSRLDRRVDGNAVEARGVTTPYFLSSSFA
jgi:hypothetical protein